MIDSVKKAFVLSVKALKLFYVLAAINIVTNIINLLVIPAPVDAELSVGRSFGVMGITILFVLIGVFVYGGSLAYIKELIKAGSAGLGSFVDNGKKYFLRLLGVSILLLLISLGVGVALFSIITLLPPVLKTLLTIIVVILLIALAILFVMPAYALVANELGVIEAVKKGILAGKNNFLKILGIAFIMFLVAIAVMIVASLLSGILSFILRPLSGIIAAIVMAIAYSMLTLLISIAYMDFYLKNSEQGAQS